MGVGVLRMGRATWSVGGVMDSLPPSGAAGAMKKFWIRRDANQAKRIMTAKVTKAMTNTTIGRRVTFLGGEILGLGVKVRASELGVLGF
jgi:hypothetical protein